MAEVALLDRDHAERAACAGLVQPRAAHVRNARRLERVEQPRRAQEAALEQVRVRRLLACSAGEDGAVAVIDALDADQRLLLRIAGVVAMPFPERPLESRLGGRDLA